jgi:thioredoxin-related protein
MSRRAVLPVALLLFSLSVAGFAQSIAWRADLSSARAEARKTGKIMMIDVYTDWCGWCKKLDTDTYTDAKVIAGSSSFIPLKINPETSTDGAAFVKTFGVSGFPTILFVEADGTLTNKIVGYLDGASFSDAMTKTLSYAPKVKALLAEFNAGRYAKSPDLLSMLVDLGRVDEAKTVLDKLRSSGGLSNSVQESAAFSIADSYFGDDQYDGAITYLKIVEDINSGSDTTRQAYLMHAVAIYYTKGKTAGMGYLDALIANPKTPSGWKSDIQDLRDKMKAAKE